MSLQPPLQKIRNDLEHLKKYETVVYGSYVAGQRTIRSDIDIAVITHEQSREKNIKIWKNMLKKTKPPYQIKIFELLPLQLKEAVAEESKTIFGSPLEISEYFYHFRKLWKDMKHRYYENQFSGFREKIRAMST